MKISSNTVKIISRGHQSIVAAIDKIQTVSRSYSQSILRLKELNDMLAAHIKYQDEEFYERLFQFYANDRKSTKMLEFLTYDLNDLRVKYLVFFDKYLDAMGEGVARNFPKDFKEFIETIVARMQVEEEYLFPLIRKKQAQ